MKEFYFICDDTLYKTVSNVYTESTEEGQVGVVMAVNQTNSRLRAIETARLSGCPAFYSAESAIRTLDSIRAQSDQQNR